MIELHQFFNSTFCQKVRWVLDYKKIPWVGIEVSAITMNPLRSLNRKIVVDKSFETYTVPTIYDTDSGESVTDSSPIIRYLEDRFPETPPILTKDTNDKKIVYNWMVWIDSLLGNGGRRLFHTQFILEKPTILMKFLFTDLYNGILNLPVIDTMSSYIFCGAVIKRYRLRYNEEDKIYEKVETFLYHMLGHLEKRKYIFGECFTAADITFASHLRQLRIVPYFKNNCNFEPLFEWQESICSKHEQQYMFACEDDLNDIRRRRKWYLTRKKNEKNEEKEYMEFLVEPRDRCVATNDIQPLSKINIFPWLFSIPYSKYRMRHRSGIVKISC